MTLPLELDEVRSVAELQPILSFTVRGLPVPQGSMSGFKHPKTGRVIVTHQHPKALRLWQKAIADEARKAMGESGVIRGPIGIIATFVIPRPAGHYGTRGVLPSAPKYPAVTPDLDKYLRALLDALTSIVFHDDAQVVTVAVRKIYGETPGARVGVTYPADPLLTFDWSS